MPRERTPRALARRAWDRFAEHSEPAVFLPAALLVVGFVAFGTLRPDVAHRTFRAVQTWIGAHFGWFYLLTATGALLVVVYVAFGDRGRVKLGPDDAEPEFGLGAWLSMLLAAGVGIGVVFFGVAEPLHHLATPPGDGEGAVHALRWTFFHWGLHPWAIYCTLAIPLALLHFRHGLPLAPRSLLHPLIGDRIHGPIGHVVDVLCTVGTLLGVATSLGLGAAQINAGFGRLFGWATSTKVQLAIIATITAVATVSVVSGIEAGVRRLSQLNMGLAAVVLLYVLVAGPTLYVVELFVSSLGAYVQKLPETSLWIDPQSDWQQQWTFFYWAWWFSWSPFVGIFVARISRGRRVREVVLGALLVPTSISAFWFAVVGGTGIDRHHEGTVALDAEAPTEALYDVLETLPLPTVGAAVVTLLLIVFFITSSDSGSLVDDMVTSGGDPDPPTAQRVFWAVSEGAVAATALVAGGLEALRSLSLSSGLAMAAFSWLAAAGLVVALRREGPTET